IEVCEFAFLGVHAEEVPHTGQEFLVIKGFGEIVIGTGVEAFKTGLRASTGSQDDHWDRSQRWVPTDGLEQIPPTHTWHHEIGKNQVRAECLRLLKPFSTINRRGSPVVTAEQVLQVAAQIPIVLYDEYERRLWVHRRARGAKHPCSFRRGRTTDPLEEIDHLR